MKDKRKQTFKNELEKRNEKTMFSYEIKKKKKPILWEMYASKV